MDSEGSVRRHQLPAQSTIRTSRPCYFSVAKAFWMTGSFMFGACFLCIQKAPLAHESPAESASFTGKQVLWRPGSCILEFVSADSETCIYHQKALPGRKRSPHFTAMLFQLILDAWKLHFGDCFLQIQTAVLSRDSTMLLQCGEVLDAWKLHFAGRKRAASVWRRIRCRVLEAALLSLFLAQSESNAKRLAA